jgi:hypothetical protein
MIMSMKHKLGLVFLMLLVSGIAVTVKLENPVNGDLRSGFVAAVSTVVPDAGCRAYRGSIDIYDSTGSPVASNWVNFRGVGPSEMDVYEETGQGMWSGYWDGSTADGQYNVTMTIFETCQGATQSATDNAIVTMEAPIAREGLAGTLQRTGEVATSVIVLVFGVDLAQIVNPNTATTLIDEFGGLSFALLLFGFVVPFVLSYAILYDMFFLVGFFRPNTAKLIAFIIALMFSRGNGFGALYSILFTVFMNFWISMLSLLFMMMVLYWVLGHLIWGYKFAQEINTQTEAIDYLHKVGKHLERVSEKK